MNECIVKSTRNNLTLFFTGWNPKNRFKPRFSLKEEDAEYLSLPRAKNVRDSLMDRRTKVSVCRVNTTGRVA